VIFQDFLNAELNKKGWGGSELARQMKRIDQRAASASAVNAWRRGEYEPKREHIPAIAITLETSEQELWQMVQPAVKGDMEVAEMLAREIPASMKQFEVRLLVQLMRGNVQSIQRWNREEDARDKAKAFEGTSRNTDEGAPPQVRQNLP